jgi:hypothetical protein
MAGIIDKVDRAALAPAAYTAMQAGGAGGGSVSSSDAAGAAGAASAAAAASSANSEFEVPTRVRLLWEQKQFGPNGVLTAVDPATDEADVAVNICYSTDTVGGNSGSPVLNAKGELIGVNFDRQSSGLMNEFKWSSKHR